MVKLKGKIMKTKLAFLAVVAFFSTSSGTLAVEKADEALKFRIVIHNTFAQSQETPGIANHVVTLIRQEGLVFFSDGQVGTTSSVAVADYQGSAGKFFTYGAVSTSDGSELDYKIVGEATQGSDEASISGNVEITGGSGKFEGAKGDGKMEGKRLSSAITVGAGLYNDFDLTWKK
jgi:hypothetical protein